MAGYNVSQGGKLVRSEFKSVMDARAAMLAAITPLGSEIAQLVGAFGRVLARPVVAERDQPPYSASAMDGYAVRADDTPATLQVIGETAAGRAFKGVFRAGAAVRISTGAPLPGGADAIVIQEDVTRAGDLVTVPPAKVGRHVRPRGGDFEAGTLLLPMGRKLDGVALALAAAAGMASLAVARQPRVAILCSGDELVAPGGLPGPFQIYDSATHGIAALIQGWGGVAQHLVLARDSADDIASAAERGLRESDLLVVLGGASVGDHDHARPALVKLGLVFAVEKIAVRPGKPTWFGVTPQGPVLGLPGNPASALVCAWLFLRPLMERMLGRDPSDCTRFRRARLVHPLPANGPREHYLRSQTTMGDDGISSVRAFEDQDSSLLSVFAAANALICLAPNTNALPAGTLVDVLLLDLP
jgi:molybdopterin molybdotransferase